MSSGRIQSVRGVHTVGLVDKVLTQRVFDSPFWKERCFALTPETLVTAAAKALDYVGGSYGNFNVASPFLCFFVKLLQLGPSVDIAREFVVQTRYVYLRLLGAFYVRMVAPPARVHQLLEPLLADYRRIRQRDYDGSFADSHVDVFVDQLLVGHSVCGVTLPRLPKRPALEKHGLGPRPTALTVDELADAGLPLSSRVVVDPALRFLRDTDTDIAVKHQRSI